MPRRCEGVITPAAGFFIAGFLIFCFAPNNDEAAKACGLMARYTLPNPARSRFDNVYKRRFDP
jgi:hypothetical protein